MAKKNYIAALIAIAFTVTACQKTELQDLGIEEPASQTDEKIAEDVHIDVSDSKFNNGALDENIRPGGNIDISVKEVSDGDEESDDDENKSQD